ncbi:MAG TPA: hypothetical protein VFN74_00925, partial [Chloroflexota bacterium]|nr:hypothetical protein [Chloroflexota bacterium]
IRSVLSQSHQLVAVGEGRYAFLPRLLDGTVVRLPLTEKRPAHHPLMFTEEVRLALWPDFFDNQKHKLDRPITATLPDGSALTLALEYTGVPGGGGWGAVLPERLRRYLVECRAAAGDALLVRVVNGVAGTCDTWFESHATRPETAIAERNQAVLSLMYEHLRRSRSSFVPLWELVVPLLARGHFRDAVPPDSLATILRGDARFAVDDYGGWRLAGREIHVGNDSAMPFPELRRPSSAMGASGGRATMERTLGDLRAALADHDFSSIDEANSFLQRMLAAGGIPPAAPETPLRRAQELIYDAWEAPTRRERVKLARKALETSPLCADAYSILAEEVAYNAQEAADYYAMGVAAGERALGPAAFKEDVGHFWGIIETRPYMRARAGLARACWELGERDAAVEHMWDMLKLNPGDNQGLRYVLLGWLLELQDGAPVQRLLNRFKQDASATWLYGRALHVFRTDGKTERSRRTLAEAWHANEHVPVYLLRWKAPPRDLPETIGFGDEDEAVECEAELGTAWRNTPGALEWLMDWMLGYEPAAQAILARHGAPTKGKRRVVN